MSDSVRPHRRQPTRLPCPWDSPGKNTGVPFHADTIKKTSLKLSRNKIISIVMFSSMIQHSNSKVCTKSVTSKPILSLYLVYFPSHCAPVNIFISPQLHPLCFHLKVLTHLIFLGGKQSSLLYVLCGNR